MIEYNKKKNLSIADSNALESASRLIRIIVKSAGTTVAQGENNVLGDNTRCNRKI